MMKIFAHPQQIYAHGRGEVAELLGNKIGYLQKLFQFPIDPAT